MIKLLKLTTGEEVIADVEEAESNALALKNAVRLVLSQEGVGMMPFSPFTKSDTVSIDNQHVIFAEEPDDEVKNAYNSKFGSGLVVAPAGLKID